MGVGHAVSCGLFRLSTVRCWRRRLSLLMRAVLSSAASLLLHIMPFTCCWSSRSRYCQPSRCFCGPCQSLAVYLGVLMMRPYFLNFAFCGHQDVSFLSAFLFFWSFVCSLKSFPLGILFLPCYRGRRCCV
jgi:hypothetical protein